MLGAYKRELNATDKQPSYRGAVTNWFHNVGHCNCETTNRCTGQGQTNGQASSQKMDKTLHEMGKKEIGVIKAAENLPSTPFYKR